MTSTTFRVQDAHGHVYLQTDDWTEAEHRALVRNWTDAQIPLTVIGIHPTHQWDNDQVHRCITCGAWDNGSYGSHAPCGFGWSHDSLVSVLERLSPQSDG